jgi:hypothetical protein
VFPKGTVVFVNKYLAAETHLADGNFVKEAVNREEFLKLRVRTGIPEIHNRDRQHFKPELT